MCIVRDSIRSSISRCISANQKIYIYFHRMHRNGLTVEENGIKGKLRYETQRESNQRAVAVVV